MVKCADGGKNGAVHINRCMYRTMSNFWRVEESQLQIINQIATFKKLILVQNLYLEFFIFISRNQPIIYIIF